MTKPTREEIIEAYESLDFLCVSLFNNPDTRLEKLAAAQTAIEKVLPPKPRSTMADVEWDDKRHFLAVVDVDHEVYKKAIMLQQNVYDDSIQCFALHPHRPVVCHFGPAFLTPTGERYTYTEVQDG